MMYSSVINVYIAMRMQVTARTLKTLKTKRYTEPDHQLKIETAYIIQVISLSKPILFLKTFHDIV